MKNRTNINLKRALSKHLKEVRRRRMHKRHVFCDRFTPTLLTCEQSRIAQRERITVLAPRIFSISKNHDETVALFNKISDLVSSNKFVMLDLSHVDVIDLETVCLLSAFMMLPSEKIIYLAVTTPKKNHNTVGKMLYATQFKEIITRRKRRNFTHGSFLSRTDTNLNQDAIRGELDKTLKFFGEENFEKLKNLNSILVEIVDNTANHANPKQRNSIPWILNTMEMEDANGKKTKQYCLVDLGVGIYNSLVDKTEQFKDSRKFTMKKWVLDIRGKRTQSMFFAANIPRGIESTTGDSSRGKGIKYVYEQANQSDIYTRFEIITNKVHLNLLNLSTANLDEKENFSGTIYIWEVTI